MKLLIMVFYSILGDQYRCELVEQRERLFAARSGGDISIHCVFIYTSEILCLFLFL
jgi:hypothetical protein